MSNDKRVYFLYDVRGQKSLFPPVNAADLVCMADSEEGAWGLAKAYGEEMYCISHLVVKDEIMTLGQREWRTHEP